MKRTVLLLSVLFLSLNTMLSSFFYFTVLPRTSFLSMAEWFPQHGLLCFVLAIINNVTINICAKVWCGHAFISLGFIPKS